MTGTENEEKGQLIDKQDSATGGSSCGEGECIRVCRVPVGEALTWNLPRHLAAAYWAAAEGGQHTDRPVGAWICPLEQERQV